MGCLRAAHPYPDHLEDQMGRMPRKRYKPEQIVAILKEAKTATKARQLGGSVATSARQR
jgi:hypothetical protein